MFDDDMIRSDIAQLQRNHPNVNIGYSIKMDKFVAYFTNFDDGKFYLLTDGKTPNELDMNLKKVGF